MAVTALVGAQWGDEGKGRIVDFLAQQADVVIRFQGGDNAGHTVINEYGTFRLHLVPSGIFNPSVKNVIGTGTVVNPDALLREMHELAEAGVGLSNLWLSERAQMLMPYHRLLDGLEERDRGGGAIGTTGRGIGPAYADKAARWGLQLGDLKDPDWLRRRLEAVLPFKNALLQYYGQPALQVEPLMEQCLTWAAALEGRIVDTLPMIRDAVLGKKDVILEGQLGIMRDLDWGIYPYVTSSNPSSAFAAVGAGIPPTAISRVIGIVKAYSTAVGAGPFPVELTDKTGETLREVGKEYGATTGRPRRCGWFDGVAIAHAAWLNGFTELAITKLDVMDSLPEIKVCTGYRVGDEVLTHLPATHVLERAEPVYETWPGWLAPTGKCSAWSDLPGKAQKYLCRIEELAGVPIRWVSVGPERERMFPVMRTLKI
jgi:adenylosuccinate synthase